MDEFKNHTDGKTVLLMSDGEYEFQVRFCPICGKGTKASEGNLLHQ